MAINLTDLNPIFAGRISAAVAAAEKATGQKASFLSGRRTAAQGVDIWNRATGGGRHAPSFPAARPGRSLHEQGLATDMAPGKVRDWIVAHAKEYGLAPANARRGFGWDPNHIQLDRGVLKTPYDSTPNALAPYAAGTPTRGLMPAQQAAADLAGGVPGGPPRVLRTGATDARTGGAVTRLQQQLTDAGFDVGPHGIDGRFGKDTAAAVRQVEKQFNLPTRDRGVAGPQVQGALAGTAGNAPVRTSIPLPAPRPPGGVPTLPGSPPPMGIGRNSPVVSPVRITQNPALTMPGPPGLLTATPASPDPNAPPLVPPEQAVMTPHQLPLTGSLVAGGGVPGASATIPLRMTPQAQTAQVPLPRPRPTPAEPGPGSRFGFTNLNSLPARYGPGAGLSARAYPPPVQTAQVPGGSVAGRVYPDPNTFGLDRRSQERQGAARAALTAASAPPADPYVPAAQRPPGNDLSQSYPWARDMPPAPDNGPGSGSFGTELLGAGLRGGRDVYNWLTGGQPTSAAKPPVPSAVPAGGVGYDYAPPWDRNQGPERVGGPSPYGVPQQPNGADVLLRGVDAYTRGLGPRNPQADAAWLAARNSPANLAAEKADLTRGILAFDRSGKVFRDSPAFQKLRLSTNIEDRRGDTPSAGPSWFNPPVATRAPVPGMSDAAIQDALQGMIEGPPVGPQDNISNRGRPANQSAFMPTHLPMGMTSDYGTGIPQDASSSGYGALPARFNSPGYVPFPSGGKRGAYASAGPSLAPGGAPGGPIIRTGGEFPASDLNQYLTDASTLLPGGAQFQALGAVLPPAGDEAFNSYGGTPRDARMPAGGVPGGSGPGRMPGAAPVPDQIQQLQLLVASAAERQRAASAAPAYGITGGGPVAGGGGGGGNGGVPNRSPNSAGFSVYTMPASSIIGGGSGQGSGQIAWSPSGYSPESHTPYATGLGQTVDQYGNRVNVGAYNMHGQTYTYTY